MQEQLANGTEKQTDWNNVNWRRTFKNVRNLRYRIFRASKEEDYKKVRSLQKLMLKSYSNSLISVRKVTQTNKGKYTAGVDKVTVKTPEERGKLADQIHKNDIWKARPAKRIYIPKSNGKERPLGIPTIRDRCIQAKVKNALEPYWEARFERTSYGFRPGRGCQDAIQAIFSICRSMGTKKWVVDADIKGAFDNISHNFLLDSVDGFPARGIIKQWLKAGYMDKGVFHETNSGTPQGSVISPLLANIALHGMEEALGVTREKVKTQNREIVNSPRTIIRYADDFAIFCKTKEDAEESLGTIKEWLKDRGLAISEEKTRIVHLSDGFDFLGFNVRQYKSVKNKHNCKLLIKPNKKSIQKFRDTLREIWRNLKGCNINHVIAKLNPVIRGWANYFRSGVSYKTFYTLDHWMWVRQYLFARHEHRRKPYWWIKKKYWGNLNLDKPFDKWVFGNKTTGQHMLKFKWFKIERHVMVKGCSSPDDPTLKEYWRKRESRKAAELTPSRNRIAKRQNHICPVCRQSLYHDEELHLHHIKPKSEGGDNKWKNLILVHLYCHQQIHSLKNKWTKFNSNLLM